MADTPHTIDVYVGSRLRLRRSLMGMSQERLGQLLGVTFQQIQKYERGVNRIGSSRLFEIGRIMDVPVSWFFEGMPSQGGKAAAPGHGLEEEDAPFLFETESPASRDERAPLVDRRETLELVRAFNRIADPLVRRRLFELTKALGNIEYRRASKELPPLDPKGR